ncbi:MAG TPA: helix-turn-helix transcriptional regulator [Streptosporangiaceae bacterium]|nr:helix-turn-helix transcriptional regulator [Streptosporangiaceae bacterium]
MSDFGRELARLMQERAVGVRELARAAYCNPGHISNLRSGKARPSPQLAEALDRHLGAGGTLAATAASSAPGRRRGRGTRSSEPSRAVEALQVAMNGGDDGLGIAGDGLAELVGHYADAVAIAPSPAVYDELVSARSFAGTLLSRGGRAQRPGLVVTAGWLSSLLAISATDLGDHGAAVVWCADTERRGRDAGYPELLGWAALTRSLIAWYQGDPVRSAAAARRGQAEALAGTVARAKLAAQEMRCLAMLGDMAGMSAARSQAATAMSQLGPSAQASGIYSVPRAEDPPYTATSLLLAGRHREAAEMTRRIIATAYSPHTRAPGGQPTNYARTLLILALAAAGLGEIDEAAAAGAAALAAGHVVWPTMVLAGKLDQSLAARSPGSPHAMDFRVRYIDAGTRLALPAAPASEGNASE